MTNADIAAKRGCAQFLCGHRNEDRPLVTLPSLLAELRAGDLDYYGSGPTLEALEVRFADLLGKPAARFVITGVIAQSSVIRACAASTGLKRVVLHPNSHIAADEGGALVEVHALEPVLLGGSRHFTCDDLESLTEPVALVIVELPLRRRSYRLPDWEELHRISDWCRRNRVWLHLDGARLSEAAAGYGCNLDTLAGIADSVYVSLYKGLGGPAGAIIAGPARFLQAVNVWQARLGGKLASAAPYVLAAAHGLDAFLPRMPEFVARARKLAAAIGCLPGVAVDPPVPHVNAFQLHMPCSAETLRHIHRQTAQESGRWLFDYVDASPDREATVCEIVIGTAADTYSDEEAVRWIDTLLRATLAVPASSKELPHE